MYLSTEAIAVRLHGENFLLFDRDPVINISEMKLIEQHTVNKGVTCGVCLMKRIKHHIVNSKDFIFAKYEVGFLVSTELTE